MKQNESIKRLRDWVENIKKLNAKLGGVGIDANVQQTISDIEFLLSARDEAEDFITTVRPGLRAGYAVDADLWLDKYGENGK